MAQMTLDKAFQLACEHHNAGRFQQAEGIYRQILSVQPNHAETLNLLGTLATQVGQHAAGIPLIRRAIELDPSNGSFCNNLGQALTHAGELEEAVVVLRRATELNRDSWQAFYNLGRTLAMLQRAPEAIEAYKASVRINPNFPASLNNLANLYKDAGEYQESVAAYQRAIQLDPKAGDFRSNLGQLYQFFGQLDLANEMFQTALQLDPKLVQAHTGLGNVMKDQGKLDAAMIEYRKALALSPADHRANSNLLYAAWFDPDATAASIGRDHEKWDREIAAPIRANLQPHGNDRNPDRKLRVGYVSPDFFKQAESFFVVPLLRAHDRTQYEVHGYSSVRHPDDMTNTIRGLCDVWHEVKHLSDEALAARLRDDQIDVLIDLTMHMSSNRMLTFARKPAPVQIAWLAYPGTTGLRAIDYRITDRFMDPEGSDQSWSAEKPIRLPDSWCVYDSLENASTVGPLPVLSSGHVTFGSINNFCKTNRHVIALWSDLLARIPSSRLILAAPQMKIRQEILSQFASKGVEAGRIEFIESLPRPAYLAMYDRIDICLDPFPYNGITTTCDALWKGVPVLNLTGTLPQARAGMSLLEMVGLGEFVTRSAEEFLQKGVELAADISRLAPIRAGLRDRMIASPLTNADRFARNVEAAYRTAWQAWCAGA